MYTNYRCKFLSRALAVYCLAQLPESKPASSDQQLSTQSSQSQIVRFTPHSPGVAPPRATSESADGQSSPLNNGVLEVRPSAEAVRAMQSLEALLVNKQYAELRSDIEQSVRMIRDSANSLHNAVEVCGALVAELYSQRYLHALTE